MYEAVSDSDIIFFTVPVRYIKYVCKQMYISKPKNAHLICSCKGFVYDEDDQQLLTPGQFLSKKLSIDYSVFFMNNIIFSADNRTQGNLILNGNYKHTIIDLLRNKNVQVNLNIDKVTIEVILSLKSLVVIAMGLIDGLNLGFIFKLTLMEIALLDIIRFCLYYFPNIDFRILKDASGYNDALKRSFAGRNYICSLRMARDDTTANDVEKLLNGQTMHGYDIANSVGEFLILKGNIKEFPFFKTIYEVVIGKKPAYDIKKLLGKNV